MHTRNIYCTFPHFTHALGVFDSLRIAYSGLEIYHFADRVFREDHTHDEEPGVLFTWSPGLDITSCFLLFLFILCII